MGTNKISMMLYGFTAQKYSKYSIELLDHREQFHLIFKKQIIRIMYVGHLIIFLRDFRIVKREAQTMKKYL